MNTEKEKLLNDTYYKWIQTSLNDLPLDGANDFVDPKIMGYGTAIDEKVLSISDYRELIKSQREQSVGLEMNFEITPVFRSISNKEDSAIFVDEIKVSIILREGKQELFLRLTTILEYINIKWIVVHWHGSKPTETLGETDTWLVNEWKQKNEELEKLVNEKTSELLNKNRELEIETALEKVRSSALVMKQHSDMLEVCQIISEQLTNLNVNDIRNVQTAIFYESKGTYFDYEYYTKHNKTFISEINYKNHEIQTLFANQMLNGAEELFTRTFKDKELKDWYEYQKNTNQFADPLLETAESLNYYWYSLGPVALGMSTYLPLKEEEINLFKRFRNVFELAYRRFMDIQKAEAQAREAKIEAALEKVRAAAMSMNKPDDLLNICEVLFKEFLKLGFGELRNAMINIHNDEKGNFINYDYSDEIGKSVTLLNFNSHPVMEKQIKQARMANDAFSEAVYKGKDLEAWKEFRRKYGEKEDPRITDTKSLYYYFYSIGTGTIGISTFSPIGEEKLLLLKRFRNVFSLSYQRYTDIALAEAQAREAQIEVALERVRSRSLAMHKSDELNDVVTVLFERLNVLNIPVSAVGISIYIEDSKDWNNYVCGQNETGIAINHYRLPYFNHKIANDFFEVREKGLEFFEGHYSKEEKDSFYEYVIEHSQLKDELLDDIKQFVFQSSSYTISVVATRHAMITINDFEGGSLSDDEIDILKRFSKVFDQAYIRFLDLQKAEAQAREAQIEAALERVRSRTMGMQKSQELKEVIRVVYEQFVYLKINVDHAGFVVDYTPRGDWHFWIADEQEIPSKITHPYFESVWANQFNDAKEKGTDFFATNLNFEEKNKFYNELLSYVPGLPEASKDFYLSCPGLAISTVLLENVGLYIENFSGTPYSDEENKILMRFGKVFQQTYTRFLDLQRAESQNKIIQAENNRKTKELEDARQLQLSMLPKELPKMPNLDIAVYMKTATEVGGDYYDFNVDANGTLTFVVGDATGHGMMSGMMVSIMKSFFISNKANIELKQFFENANNSIKDMHLGRLMMSFMGIQITSHKLIATNAGMPSLIYFRNKSQKAGEFVSNNLPLGAMKGTKYLLKEIIYEKGDTLLLMSDGFAELKNKKNEQYGYPRIIEEFRSVANKNSDAIVEHLKNSALLWINGIEPDDDVTFVVIKVK